MTGLGVTWLGHAASASDGYSAYCSACREQRWWRYVDRLPKAVRVAKCTTCGKERTWVRR